jgi:microcystin-dependent protein
MPEPYVGEIRMFGGNFAPNGWMLCEGQQMAISENETLFQLIGTTYGGDGENTFNLPNLASRIPVHKGTGPEGITYQIGEMSGTEQVTLTSQQIPIHTHSMLGTTNTATAQAPTANTVAKSTQIDLFINAQPGDAMNPQAITPVGGSQPHENVQPFLCINFIISLFGVYPSAS